MTQDKILILTDKTEADASIVNYLKLNNFKVHLSQKTEDALDLFAKESYDLLLLSLNASGFNPSDTLKKFRNDGLFNPVIVIVNTKPLDTEIRDFCKYSANDILFRPIDQEEILKSINFALNRFKITEENRAREKQLERLINEGKETLQFQKEALEREQARTNGILEEAHIGFLVLDGENDEVFYLNKKGKNLFSLSDDFKINYFLKNYREIFHDNINLILSDILSKIKSDKTLIDFGSHSLNDNLIIQFKAYPILIEENISSIVIAAEDITEQKSLEKQILQSSRLADLGQMAAVVAHEINNPIAFINSNTNTLDKYLNKIFLYISKIKDIEDFLENLNIDEDKILDIYQGLLTINDSVQKKKEELHELKQSLKIDNAIKNIQEIILENLQGLDRVKKIVLDLKTFSYMGEDVLEKTDIHKIIEESLTLTRNEIKYKAEVVRKYKSVPLLKCYPRQICQVLTNMIVNAGHAIKNKGTITISTYFDNPCVNIEISDTGEGMPEEVMKKIFNPFFTTKKINKGTGLGLSISYKIIEKHSGSIKVKSEVGIGTTFIISLPLELNSEKKS